MQNVCTTNISLDKTIVTHSHDYSHLMLSDYDFDYDYASQKVIDYDCDYDYAIM